MRPEPNRSVGPRYLSPEGAGTTSARGYVLLKRVTMRA